MRQAPNREWLYTTTEFERWWEARGLAEAVENGLDPESAKPLAWDAWRTGREHLSAATASQRLQPARR